ncbi:MAG: hypothetical protein FWC56_02690, partial [Phycisphaerae bacterium]|nr:hypothetical protein [Phycisphaerae bacterium]
KDLGSSSYPFLRVSRPDMWAREILSPSADLDATDMMVEGSIPLLSPPLYPQLVRFYTEWSFWNAERSGVPLSPVFPVDAQNLAPTLIPVPEMPPMPEVLGAGPSPARISIADRVYPPVDVFYPNNTMRPLYTIGNELGILNEVASRRYCWTALHYRDLAQAQDQKQNSFFCQIVLLYRSKLESRYVRQDPSTWPIEPPYPSVIPPTVKPVSSPGINDITLFPQAWMVWVHVYPDPSDPTFMDGEVICTGTVARLLPVGSYMISVDSGQLSTGASVSPGVSAKILRNSWSGDVNLDAKLQIAPGSFPIGLSRRVWVFPPAFDGTRFERVSPVVDVISKRVYTQ